jgi:predicted transcriptional regulator
VNCLNELFEENVYVEESQRHSRSHIEIAVAILKLCNVTKPRGLLSNWKPKPISANQIMSSVGINSHISNDLIRKLCKKKLLIKYHLVPCGYRLGSWPVGKKKRYGYLTSDEGVMFLVNFSRLSQKLGLLTKGF